MNDNLPVLRGMNSATVDLIYLDPPFNSRREYSAPIGSKAEGQMFTDTWRWDSLNVQWLGEIARHNEALAVVIEAARQTQGPGTAAYLTMMGVRMLEMHRTLKLTGTLYLHCNQSAGHYLKLALDAVFGAKNFVTEIVWNYGTPSGGRASGKKPVKTHDTLFVFAKRYGKHIYHRQHTPYSEKYINDWFRHVDEDGRRYQTRSRKGKGIVRQYLDRSLGLPLSTVWSDVMQLSSRRGWFPTTNKEETGWATQKPLALLQRIIRASSNEGDMVLDPFAGCATCLVAAQMESRRWVGMEACEAANDILRSRLLEADLGELGRSTSDAKVLKRPPKRTDLNGDELAAKKRSRRYNSPENIDLLYGTQRGDCTGCGNHYHSKDFAVDHVVPQAHGGSDELDNLQLLCTHCNSTKGTGTMDDLFERLAHQDQERLATLRA